MKKLLLFLFAIASFAYASGQCTELFISEYVEGGYNNKALEIYNPTSAAIDLSGYRIVRYSNGGTTPAAIGIGGTLQAADVVVIVLDKRDVNGTGMDTIVFDELRALADTFLCPVYSVNKMMYFNGNDAVTLETSTGTYIDIFGVIGQDPGYGWTTDTTAGFTTALGAWAWTKDHAMIRKHDIQQGITTNPTYFNPSVEWDSLPKNTFNHLGWHVCDCTPNTVKEVKLNHDFFVYPNPVKDQKLLVKGSAIIKSVEIFNILGQSEFFKLNDINRGDMKIQLNGFNDGLYLIKVIFDDNSTSLKKVIIE